MNKNIREKEKKQQHRNTRALTLKNKEKGDINRGRYQSSLVRREPHILWFHLSAHSTVRVPLTMMIFMVTYCGSGIFGDCLPPHCMLRHQNWIRFSFLRFSRREDTSGVSTIERGQFFNGKVFLLEAY